ncbi:MAG: hypothetical protein ACYTGV_00745 [Planctomycetota bacterium]
MRSVDGLASLVLGLALLSTLLLAQADDDRAGPQERVSALVAKLSAPSAETRDTARRRLLDLGERISPLLERRFRMTGDPELRARLQELLTLLPFAEDARRAGVEAETYVRCATQIDALSTKGAPEAVAALLEDAEEYFPILIARMDDFRPMGVRAISFATGPGAPESLLHYGPKKVVDCITIVLALTSDQSFGSLHNGGTDEKRRVVIRRWREWYAKARPFVLWDSASRRHIVDDAAWVAGIPLKDYRRLSEERQSEELERAFERRDRVFQQLTKIAPAPPRGELKTLIDALKDDPYRPPAFDSPPSVSETMRRLAARREAILPAMAHTYHRAFDRSVCVSVIATIGELGGKTAPKVLKAWMAFEHRSFCRYTIERVLAKMR